MHSLADTLSGATLWTVEVQSAGREALFGRVLNMYFLMFHLNDHISYRPQVSRYFVSFFFYLNES